MCYMQLGVVSSVSPDSLCCSIQLYLHLVHLLMPPTTVDSRVCQRTGFQERFFRVYQHNGFQKRWHPDHYWVSRSTVLGGKTWSSIFLGYLVRITLNRRTCTQNQRVGYIFLAIGTTNYWMKFNVLGF